MDYPMRSDLRAGNKFPDFELPDHTGERRKLSSCGACSKKACGRVPREALIKL